MNERERKLRENYFFHMQFQGISFRLKKKNVFKKNVKKKRKMWI